MISVKNADSAMFKVNMKMIAFLSKLKVKAKVWEMSILIILSAFDLKRGRLCINCIQNTLKLCYHSNICNEIHYKNRKLRLPLAKVVCSTAEFASMKC